MTDDPTNANEVSSAVLAWVNARTDAELRPLVEARWAHLNTESADTLIGRLLEDYADNPTVVDRLRSRRHLLDRCRSEGIHSAFASGSRQFEPRVDEIVQEYLVSESGQNLRRIFLDHRETLTGAEAERVLAYLERYFRDEPTRLRRIRERRDLLRVAIDRGVDRAFPVVSDQDALIAALDRLMNAPDWPRRLEIIREESAVLLTEEADRYIEYLASLSPESSDPTVQALVLFRAVFARARRDGLDAIRFDGGLPALPVVGPIGEAERAQMAELRALLIARFGENTPISNEEIQRLLGERPDLQEAWQRLRPFIMFFGENDPDRVELQGILTKIKELDRFRDAEEIIRLLRRAAEIPLVQHSREMWAGFQSTLASMLLGHPGDRAALLEEGLNRAELAERVFTKEKYPVEWANNRWMKGNLLTHRMVGSHATNVERALECFESARATLDERDTPYDRVTRWISLGNAYSLRVAGSIHDNIEKALEFLRLALDAREFRSLDERSQGDALSIFGNAMGQRSVGEAADNVEEALDALRKAEKLYSAANVPDRLGLVHYSIALLMLIRQYGGRGANRAAALDNLAACLRFCKREEWPERWARAQLLYAQIVGADVRNREQLDEASKSFHAAQSVFTRAISPYEWAGTERGFGEAFLAMARISGGRQDIDTAIRHLESALEVYSRNTDSIRWAGLHLDLGRLHAMLLSHGVQDAAERAEAHFRLSLEETPIESFPALHAQAQTMLASLLVDLHRWDDAHRTLSTGIRAGIASFESAYTEVGRHVAVEVISSLFAVDAYALVRLGRYDEALLRLDEGKSRILAQSLALTDASLVHLDSHERSELQEMRRTVQQLEARMRSIELPQSGATDRRLAAELKESRARLASLLTRLRARIPGFVSTSLTMPELLALIPPGGALVAPLITQQGTAVFVLPDGCKQVTERNVLRIDSCNRAWLVAMLQGGEGSDDLGGWLKAYTQQHENPQPWLDAIEGMGHELWACFMGPIHEALIAAGVREGAPVVLMPQGGLALLPMHSAWHEAEGERRYFLDHYVVSNAPSGYALSVSANRLGNLGARASSLLAVIDPTGNLVSARAEGDALEILFGSACTSLRQNAATLDAVRRAAPGRTHIHFCCHGSYDWQDPMKSALHLAGADTLTLADVLGTVNLEGVRLVILSACETGISDIRRVPDEYIGLPAGFLRAGAAGVISALWPVDDLSTMLLMEHFYHRHISCGEPPAAALRDAQRWLRSATNQELADDLRALQRNVPEELHRSFRQARHHFADRASRYPTDRPFQHPYYWAAFLLNGG
jgi:CHAT domain-containing protein/tetratricopeptide (TPR) repeat protein